jgi:hypothetical protein
VVELIGELNGLAERKFSRQDDVFSAERDDKAPWTVQEPIPGIAVSSAMSSSSSGLLKIVAVRP